MSVIIRTCQRLAVLLVFTTAAMAAAGADKTDAHWPAPIQKLADQGLTIVKPFSAPDGLKGFAAEAGDTPVALYLMPDGQHVLVGTLLDANGKNLTKPALEAAVVQPQQQAIWPGLATLHWVADGKASAPRTVYVFVDPNCPYCHKFYEESRPWVAAGKVQLRQILVGVLRPSSPGKAAAILAASDPTQAYYQHEKAYRSGGIKALNPVPDKLAGWIAANNIRMAQLHIRGTPGIVYRDASGEVQIHQGVPHGQTLTAIMGPR